MKNVKFEFLGATFYCILWLFASQDRYISRDKDLQKGQWSKKV